MVLRLLYGYVVERWFVGDMYMVLRLFVGHVYLVLHTRLFVGGM